MKLRPMRVTIQKRSFLLFELLISLALIVLCFFPLIKPHASMRKANIEQLEHMQLERAAQEAFCYIKEQLYENKLRWKDLIHKDPKELEQTFTIWVGKNKAKSFNCSYTTSLLDKINKTSQNKVGLLMEIALQFSPSQHAPFIRTLYLEQLQL